MTTVVEPGGTWSPGQPAPAPYGRGTAPAGAIPGLLPDGTGTTRNHRSGGPRHAIPKTTWESDGAAGGNGGTPGPRPSLTPRRPSLLPDLPPRLALAAIYAGAVGVIALWWRNTPSVKGTGEWLTNGGRITGLLAGYVVVILLLLMSRIPAMERGIGSDRLARWHSMGGRYVVSLTAAHAVLIIWGYSVTSQTNAVDQTKTLLQSYPNVLMATVALGLFLLIGFVSARAVRRRVRHETWYFIHFYTYLAIALSFSHQFANGAEFVADRTARIAWSTLYILAGLAVLWFRWLGPVRVSMRHKLRVARVVPEADGVVSLWITGRRMEELGALPGQFMRWRFLTRHHWWSANPYSLSAVPRSNMLRITVKDAGDHSRSMRRMRPGTKVFAEGPYGALTPTRRTRRGVLLVAGGVGITPMRTLFEALPFDTPDVVLLYRASSEADLVFRNELDQLSGITGARVHYLVGRRGSPADLAGPQGPQTLHHFVPDVADRDVFVCGPQAMADSTIAALRDAGVPRRRIHNEDFTF